MWKRGGSATPKGWGSNLEVGGGTLLSGLGYCVWVGFDRAMRLFCFVLIVSLGMLPQNEILRVGK